MAPVLNSLAPASAIMHSPDVELHCIGTGFDDTSEIVFNGSVEPTTFHSATDVSTVVSVSGDAHPVTPGTYPVLVRGPAGDSAPKDFAIIETDEQSGDFVEPEDAQAHGYWGTRHNEHADDEYSLLDGPDSPTGPLGPE